jgi:hypothetical protein
MARAQAQVTETMKSVNDGPDLRDLCAEEKVRHEEAQA